ncbi:uncharacterized protein LOC110901294 [Helianthus annuus]|uniref:uncharacterized protein LOC110901294 n=1 Tax=Helianthus annuus TaxID=4232 RepID=UPI000B8FF53F|nr:uncharacterized protein LOC110901294 [Helianthus annuus]
MKLASCKKLTTVFYEGYLLPNSNNVTNFLSNFPFLENLVLHPDWHTIKGDNLKLSNHSLKTLELHSRFDLDEIELNTPNLGLFVYIVHPAYSYLGMSRLPHLKASMRYYPYHSIDFQKLRLFLDKESGFKALNLYICTDERSMVLEKLNAIELPRYELENIELHFDYEESPGDEALDAGHEEKSSFHAAFVDAVLCCFRPRSLTLRSSSFPLTDFEEQSALVKITHEKLFEQENQGHTNIEIVSPYSLKAQSSLGA